MLVIGLSFKVPDLRRFSTAIALAAAYDYEPKPRDDPMVSIVNEYLKNSLPGVAPMKSSLVKAFPFCKCPWLIRKVILLRLFGKVLHIPDWLPGSWIKCEARVAYAWRTKLVETPYRYVQERMVSFGWSRKTGDVTKWYCFRNPKST